MARCPRPSSPLLFANGWVERERERERFSRDFRIGRDHLFCRNDVSFGRSNFLAYEEKLLGVYTIIFMLDTEVNFCVNYKKQFDLFD